MSEDVAAVLGLPSGGRPINTRGSTGSAAGRLVNVTFRFPQTVSGGPGLEVHSMWVVTAARSDLALLGFMEVHRHFHIRTLEFDTYFIPWQALRGAP